MFWKKKNEQLNDNVNENVAKQVFAFFLGIIMTVLYFTDFGMSNFIPKKSYSQYQEIEKMVNTIEKNYYEEVDRDTLYESMKYGLFGLLEDGYSYYLGPENYKALMDGNEGIFYGYGLGGLEYTETEIMVGYTMDNSPAKAVGVLDGDAIVEINGQSFSELGETKAREIFMDNKVTTVEIGVKRDSEDELLHFTLSKANIEEKSISYELMGNVGYIHLSQFIKYTGEDFDMAVDSLMEKGATSFVIDLRNNGGGLFDEAILVADRILPKSTITYTQRRNGERKYFEATDKESLKMPIVVLVNSKSASASELLTAALKDNEAAVIFGSNTFGKGIVQETYKLNDESGFKLTTKQYYSPKGTAINKIGVKPDKEIIQDETIKLKSDKDIQLKEAIEYLQK